MAHKYYLVDVFAEESFGGNPLAVFPAAENIDKPLRQLIARELNLREISFVTPRSEPASFDVGVFSPTQEMPFAGHPTIGTAHVLQQLAGKAFDMQLHMPAGTIEVSSFENQVMIAAPQTPQQLEDEISLEQAAAVLNILPQQITQTETWSAGLPFKFVQLEQPKQVDQVELDMNQWAEHCQGTTAQKLYVFAKIGMAEVYARMLSPVGGMIEDPATGSAAAALVGLLKPAPEQMVSIQQGVKLGRPSQLRAGVIKGKTCVAGNSVIIGEGKFYG